MKEVYTLEQLVSVKTDNVNYVNVWGWVNDFDDLGQAYCTALEEHNKAWLDDELRIVHNYIREYK